MHAIEVKIVVSTPEGGVAQTDENVLFAFFHGPDSLAKAREALQVIAGRIQPQHPREPEVLRAKQGVVMNDRLTPLGRIGDVQLLAAGPLSHQPASLPYRVVLLAYEDGTYSVHTEQFTEGKSSISNGHYFEAGPTGLVKAAKQFAKVVANHADYLASIFRDSP